MMSDMLKKGFYLGLGAALSGKEKAEKLLDDLVQRGDVSPSQAREMFDEFMAKGMQKDAEWSEQGKEKMQQRAKEMGFVTKDELEILEARVQRLEKLHQDKSEY
ncbi:Polyhydroxyalkanoate synthesis regulator phasin [Thalassobacillus cyri]|uniref:Polyhydroxyalkanoate synthesis regulator phasin n=2 Tax=Thalassobacillus cyri TaxID=571932 RepID=A0A1H4DGC2_9BACI|nr:Polyhydroxyalkanoate synthesis regulator phasin [Thalassobacillus cyri]